jgi:hypothetical protein
MKYTHGLLDAMGDVRGQKRHTGVCEQPDPQEAPIRGVKKIPLKP